VGGVCVVPVCLRQFGVSSRGGDALPAEGHPQRVLHSFWELERAGSGLVWSGLIWFGLVWFWFGLDFLSASFGLVWFVSGLVWTSYKPGIRFLFQLTARHINHSAVLPLLAADWRNNCNRNFGPGEWSLHSREFFHFFHSLCIIA
jgi:hypothetical protein